MVKAVHAVSDVNKIRIIDTPHMWGKPMNKSSATVCAEAALKDLSETAQIMVSGGVQLVDIVSLNPPTGSLLQAIWDGLLSMASLPRKRRVVVRFLFGFVPVEGMVESFVKALCAFCSDKKLPLDEMTILVGELYQSTKGFWNHAKIIAVDGTVALVGGHNLWAESYGTYPPVHDISVQVIGPGAAAAQNFATWLWQGGDLLAVRKITPSYGTRALNPGQDRDKTCLIELRHDHYSPMPDERYRWCTGRVLTLGRGGLLGGNASDVAKQTLIKGARRNLKICQQDLFFTGFTKVEDHMVCQWIADAVIANPNLVVDIVVSPIGGATHGAQYSWGHGASGTFKVLTEIVTAKVKKFTSDVGTLDSAIARLHVAPFCFTDVTFKAEGEDYAWPDPPSSSIVGRFTPGSMTPLGFKYPPAPGNHAKVYIVDDTCYYIGSDNLYPHNLAEFGFLIEGASVKDLLDNYWNYVWKYSSPHIVKQ